MRGKFGLKKYYRVITLLNYKSLYYFYHNMHYFGLFTASYWFNRLFVDRLFYTNNSVKLIRRSILYLNTYTCNIINLHKVSYKRVFLKKKHFFSKRHPFIAFPSLSTKKARIILRKTYPFGNKILKLSIYRRFAILQNSKKLCYFFIKGRIWYGSYFLLRDKRFTYVDVCGTYFKRRYRILRHVFRNSTRLLSTFKWKESRLKSNALFTPNIEPELEENIATRFAGYRKILVRFKNLMKTLQTYKFVIKTSTELSKISTLKCMISSMSKTYKSFVLPIAVQMLISDKYFSNQDYLTICILKFLSEYSNDIYSQKLLRKFNKYQYAVLMCSRHMKIWEYFKYNDTYSKDKKYELYYHLGTGSTDNWLYSKGSWLRAYNNTMFCRRNSFNYHKYIANNAGNHLRFLIPSFNVNELLFFDNSKNNLSSCINIKHSINNVLWQNMSINLLLQNLVYMFQPYDIYMHMTLCSYYNNCVLLNISKQCGVLNLATSEYLFIYWYINFKTKRVAIQSRFWVKI